MVQLDWNVRDIITLYWTESVVIGVINVKRMMKSEVGNILSGISPVPKNTGISIQGDTNDFTAAFNVVKLFMIAFFIVHYGVFCLGHLAVILVFFQDSAAEPSLAQSIQTFWKPEYWIGVAAIAFSHTYSYFNNFIEKTEYQNIGLFALMFRPYGRILILHITVIAGGVFVLRLGSPLPALLILVLLKTIMDLRLHNQEREKMAVTSNERSFANQ